MLGASSVGPAGAGLLEVADRMPPAEVLRSLHAVEAQEHAGTPAAQQPLETLAKDADGAGLSRADAGGTGGT